MFILFQSGCLITASLSNGELLPIPTSTFIRHKGSPIPTERLGLIGIDATLYPETCTSEYSCLNCTTARICAPAAGGQSFVQIALVGCHSSTPWCDSDTGSCSAKETLACAESAGVIVSDFTCMRDGYFPDLSDCSKFYHCVEDIPYMFKCLGKNHHYVPHYEACKFPSRKAVCANHNSPCAGLNGVKVPVVAAKNLFFECVGGKPWLVDRCIGAYVFNNDTQTCVPSCPRAGLFPSDEDCTKYYMCSLASTAPSETALILTMNLTCPEGQGFLEEAMQCVNNSSVPNCLVSGPGLFN